MHPVHVLNKTINVLKEHCRHVMVLGLGCFAQSVCIGRGLVVNECTMLCIYYHYAAFDAAVNPVLMCW